MNVISAILLVLVPGYLPAFALTGRRWLSALMAAVVCVAAAGLAGIACVVLGVSVVSCTLVVVVAANAVSVWMVRRRRTSPQPHPSGVAGSSSIGMLSFALCGAALVIRPPQPMAWDARSIWWFHASWFQGGGDVVVDAMRNPMLTFGHPEYPPGVPAFIGTVWALLGDEHLDLAMAITAVMSAMAVALLVAVVFPAAQAHTASVVVPILLGLAIVMQGEGLAAAGYVDVLGGSLVVLSFVWFIRDRDAAATSAFTLAAATLVKAEGLYFAVVLSVASMIWAPRRGRFALIAALAMVPALLWMATVRVATPDLMTDVRPSGFLRLALLDSARWSRARIAAPRILEEMSVYLLVAAAATAAVAVGPRKSRSTLTLSGGCAIAAGLTTAAVVGVYAAGLPEIRWWLDTSLERVLVTPRIFSLVAVAAAVQELGAFESLNSRVHVRTPDELAATPSS